MFLEYRRVPGGSRQLFMGNDSSTEVISFGAFRLDFGDGSTLLLHDVLYVPKIRRNLLSMSKLLNFGIGIEFSQNSLFLTFGFNDCLIGLCQNGLFYVDLTSTGGFANKRYSYATNFVHV